MALYLGGEKLAPTFMKTIGGGGGPSMGENYATGTAVADDDGIVTFPELSFTPKLIAVWNAEKYDLKAEAEANGDEWDPDRMPVTVVGFMAFAIYKDDMWITQGLRSESGEAYISNQTADARSGVFVDGNTYSYRIVRYTSDGCVIAGETFNYAIIG